MLWLQRNGALVPSMPPPEAIEGSGSKGDKGVVGGCNGQGTPKATGEERVVDQGWAW
jgi:hypothetical protein